MRWKLSITAVLALNAIGYYPRNYLCLLVLIVCNTCNLMFASILVQQCVKQLSVSFSYGALFLCIELL
uniref:Putative secreted protein n=1 Tax=Ixodes ricinus TaxID=34613 RepID=A0A6B0U0K6_IXORI